MNNYITGAVIKKLRGERGITQAQLAERLGVTSKAVSKWETARGLPDIAMIEDLSKALGVSVWELMSGNLIENRNRSGNVLRSKFYVCPVCGNVVHAMGQTAVECCGIHLMPLEAEELDDEHVVSIEDVEDEHFITVHRDMTREHYISFIAHLTTDKTEFIKLYPEGNAEARMRLWGGGYLYIYCNKHGLMRKKL